MECSINSPALSILMKHLVIGQRLKTPNFSAFHWSPRGSLVSIGQHFVATRVVHLPKSTETSLIIESDQRGPNHQLLQLCMARTAWSDLDQAVRAVHSCDSWLLHKPIRASAPTDKWLRFSLVRSLRINRFLCENGRLSLIRLRGYTGVFESFPFPSE